MTSELPLCLMLTLYISIQYALRASKKISVRAAFFSRINTAKNNKNIQITIVNYVLQSSVVTSLAILLLIFFSDSSSYLLNLDVTDGGAAGEPPTVTPRLRRSVPRASQFHPMNSCENSNKNFIDIGNSRLETKYRFMKGNREKITLGEVAHSHYISPSF